MRRDPWELIEPTHLTREDRGSIGRSDHRVSDRARAASHLPWLGHPLRGSLQAQLALTGPSEALTIALGTLPTREWESWHGLQLLLPPGHVGGGRCSPLILPVAWSRELGPMD